MKEKRVNVCFLIPLPPPYGGIANWSVLMKDCLVSTNYVDWEIVDTSPHKASMSKFNVVSRILGGIKRFASIKAELRALLKTGKVDVIHMTTSGQLALFRDYRLIKMARKYGIPVVYHIRFGRIPFLKTKGKLEYRLFLRNANLCSSVITIDKTTFDSLSFLNVNSEKMCYIPNPFDENRIKKLKVELPHDPKVILFAGWVTKTKGVGELIAAWNVIKNDYRDYILKICGPYKNNYMERIKKFNDLDRVVFTGEISNPLLLQEMKNAAVFVLPSYTEGFPNVVLEAMALGKPIVATKVGAIPDMLSDGCGLLIEKESVGDIVSALKRLLDNPGLRKELSENAKYKALSEYSAHNVIGMYRNIWMRLANEKAV